jgi:hypothetical protein
MAVSGRQFVYSFCLCYLVVRRNPFYVSDYEAVMGSDWFFVYMYGNAWWGCFLYELWQPDLTESLHIGILSQNIRFDLGKLTPNFGLKRGCGYHFIGVFLWFGGVLLFVFALYPI